MEPRRTFGRRPQPAIPPVLTPVPAAETMSIPLSHDAVLPSVEDEIAAWKAARGAVVPFPWRQLSLMAGLCFGIASLVLPATVNDTMQWPLYALTAVSFYVGLHKRKIKSQ